MISIMMPPLSLAQIRGSAARLRNILGIPEDSYVDIVKIMDNLPDTFGVVVEIVPVQEMGENMARHIPLPRKYDLEKTFMIERVRDMDEIGSHLPMN